MVLLGSCLGNQEIFIKVGEKIQFKFKHNNFFFFFLALLSVYLGLKDQSDSSFKPMTDEENTVFAMQC